MSMLRPCALTKTWKRQVIIRVTCLPVDSVQGMSADEAYPKSLTGTDSRRAKGVNRLRCPTNLCPLPMLPGCELENEMHNRHLKLSWLGRVDGVTSGGNRDR